MANNRIISYNFPGNTIYVDATKAFNETSVAVTIFTDEVHLNKQGNEIVTNYIVNKTIKQNLPGFFKLN